MSTLGTEHLSGLRPESLPKPSTMRRKDTTMRTLTDSTSNFVGSTVLDYLSIRGLPGRIELTLEMGKDWRDWASDDTMTTWQEMPARQSRGQRCPTRVCYIYRRVSALS